jgi:hypothetical protein
MRARRIIVSLFGIVMFFSCMGCVKYHELWFDNETQRTVRHEIIVVPKVIAYSGSSKADPMKDTSFMVDFSLISIDPDSSYKRNASPKDTLRIKQYFCADSCIISGDTVDFRHTLKVIRQHSEGKFRYYGVDCYFGMLPVPRCVTQIDVVLYYHSIDFDGEAVDESPLTFRMKKHESSSWFFPLD